MDPVVPLDWPVAGRDYPADWDQFLAFFPDEAACLDGPVDCPSEAPNCCFGRDTNLDLNLPWGRCSNDPCP